MIVVQCERCGAKFRLNFSENDKFIWVCDCCMKRHKHTPEIEEYYEVPPYEPAPSEEGEYE